MLDAAAWESFLHDPERVVGLILVVLFFAVLIILIHVIGALWMRRVAAKNGADPAKSQRELTPTQRFILAASSMSVANQYKCVVDIWGTRDSEWGRNQARMLFESSWGEYTPDTVTQWVSRLSRQEEELSALRREAAEGSAGDYTAFERSIFREAYQKYPDAGLYAWDMARILSIAGEAYLGGLMTYEETSKIALEACQNLQERFRSWDDMAGSYTLGYQLWRGKRSTDRLRYYKKLKRSWIFEAPWTTRLWDTEL